MEQQVNDKNLHAAEKLGILDPRLLTYEERLAIFERETGCSIDQYISGPIGDWVTQRAYPPVRENQGLEYANLMIKSKTDDVLQKHHALMDFFETPRYRDEK